METDPCFRTEARTRKQQDLFSKGQAPHVR